MRLFFFIGFPRTKFVVYVNGYVALSSKCHTWCFLLQSNWTKCCRCQFRCLAKTNWCSSACYKMCVFLQQYISTKFNKNWIELKDIIISAKNIYHVIHIHTPWWKNNICMAWSKAMLQYHQCVSNGVTTALYYEIDIYLQLWKYRWY